MFTLLVLGATSYAATLTVDPSDAAAYASINDAIDAAISGDEIEIKAHVYTECVNLDGKDLTLIGANPRTTVIDGSGLCTNALSIENGETATVDSLGITNRGSRAVYFDEATVTVLSVEISDSGASSINGGGVYISGGMVTFSQSAFEDNQAYYGANIYIENGASITVDQCEIQGGQASIYGGGIYMAYNSAVGGAQLILTDSEIQDNEAVYGGAGIYADMQSTVSSSDSEWSGNYTAIGNGGGLYAGDSSTVYSTRDTWSENTSSDWAGYHGGAIFIDESGTLSAIDSVFEDNSAYYGGAISNTSSGVVELSGCTFDSHWGVYGGAIYLADSATLVDQGSVFSDNVGYYYGGAIYNYSADITLNDTTLDGNSAVYGSGGAVYGYDQPILNTDGAAFIDNTAYYHGGGIHVYLAASDLLFNNTSFEGNEATYGNGGGVYSYYTNLTLVAPTFADNSAYYNGGGLYQYYYADLSIQSGSFEDNEAGQYGGGLYDYKYGIGSNDTTIEDVHFEDNIAGVSGGAILTERADSFTLAETVFYHNEANSGWGYGGGVYLLTTSSISAENNIFCGNQAYVGGGLYQASTTSGSNWNYNIFQENEASYGGGLYSNSEYDLELINNTFVGNDANNDGGAAYFLHSPVTAINNIFAYTLGGNGITGSTTSAASSNFIYNDFYVNIADDTDGFSFSTSSDGNTTDNPAFVDYSLDGDCFNDDLLLDTGSALIDAGYPAFTDTDGSISDIGATGGFGSLFVDEDGDGFLASDDCDDSDATINPDATERCDGIDNDCDGVSDESGASGETAWYPDADGDGFGNESGEVTACDAPSGYVSNDSDCDDTDATIHPGAGEIEDDGIDQDCDGFDATSDGDEGDEGDEGGDGGEGGEGGDGGDDDTGSAGGGEDTGDSGQTDNPRDTGNADGEVVYEEEDLWAGTGCGCSASKGPHRALWSFVLLGLMGLRRRRTEVS